MGLFLSLNAVVGASRAEVAQGVAELSARHRGVFKPAPASEAEMTRLVLATGRSGETIFYPADFMDWEPAAAFLSTQLRKPVFSFHIHDGDFWMFHLYVAGALVTAFNPLPEYWGELPEAELKFMRGDAAALVPHVPGLKVADIERYLRDWDEAEDTGKAYPDDEFEYGTDWQLVDFMRRLGFVYPLDDAGHPLGDCFAFSAKMEG